MPIDDVREISKIAYGFMGSQALVAALDLDLFGLLGKQSVTVSELAENAEIRTDRLMMLLTPLVALGLLVKDGDSYANSPASARYLDSAAPEYFGEYIRLQVGKQIYPHALNIGDALQGKPVGIYQEVAADRDQAAAFSHSQHIGSLGPAYLASRRLSLNNPKKLLDVAGGSGAFTISLCKKYPEIQATIIDYPAVTTVARKYVDEVGLEDRVDYIEGNALETDWPSNQDVVLMSYLLSAVGKSDIDKLIFKAYQALQPGGILVIHDFMVDEDYSGPVSAALWMLVLISSHEPVCLTAEFVKKNLEQAGFTSVQTDDHVPTITKMVVGKK